MDPLRFKRPAIQTASQTPKNTFGSSEIVPKAVEPRSFQPVERSMMSHMTYERRPIVAPASRSSLPLLTEEARNRLRPLPLAITQPTPPAPAPAPPPRRLPINMELPGADSVSHFNALISFAGQRRFRRLAFRSIALALVLVITMGGLLFSQSYLKLHKVFSGTQATAEALKTTVNPALLKGEGSGRVNVLLLGRGGGTHDGPDLTDTMMLASIDPVNHTTTLLSLPRDLWVNLPNQGVMKLNAAWETGVFKYLGKQTTGSTDPKAITAGFTMVDQTVGDVLGITIDYNVLVNFQAFQQAVDTVGGVQINVPTDLVDPTMAWENGNNPVLAKAGLQTFDGTHALIYARSRETTSDFARAQRQRALLVALKSKVATLGTLSNPVKLSGLLNAFGNNVQTDLSINDASRLYSILRNVDNSQVASIDLDSGGGGTGSNATAASYVTTGTMNGQSIVLPKAGLFKYDDIRQFVRGQLQDPYILKEKAKITVLNGTLTPGLASTKANELKSYGYNVVSVANTPNSGWTQTTLINLNPHDTYTKNYLEQRFGQPATDKLPDPSLPTNGADFVIIVGSDEAYSTQP